MSKKIIGIDINEVLRARWIQFDRFYYDEFGEDGIPEKPYVYDFWKEYEWKDSEETVDYLNEELPDDISPLDYQINEETGEAPVDSLAFKKEFKLVTAREKYKKFMYEDFLFEIHGSAPKMYKNLQIDLDKFYTKYKDQFDIRIISKENWFTIPPTLFFLSTLMSRINTYHFVENNEEIWNTVDYMITTDPELINNSYEGKSIKLLRPYNEEIKGDFEAIQIFDLIENKDFENFINFKKVEEEK